MTVTAEAVPSHASCDNEIVSVPERGRIDTVTRPLIVKVSTFVLLIFSNSIFATFFQDSDCIKWATCLWFSF